MHSDELTERHPKHRENSPAAEATRHHATLWDLPRTLRWIIPPLGVMIIGFLGILLYLGGLGSPADHMEDLPVAIVNQDDGATTTASDGSQQKVNLGDDLTESLMTKVNDSGEFNLQEMSSEQADSQLSSGEIYGAIKIPHEFSAQTVSLVPAAIGGEGDGTQPTIELITSPQAGSMSTRLVTDGLKPGLDQASESIGEDLSASADQQVQARQDAGQRVPEVTTVAQDVLNDPVHITTHAWQDLQDGTALGMSPFYWSVVLLVVGLSGSVAVHTLVDGILGIMPVDLGPSFHQYRTVELSRLTTFLVKWAIMLLAGAATSGLMMLAASVVNMPMPNGGELFLISWLSIAASSAVTLALLTAAGSLGLILSMIYLVFLGLPSAGAVVPVEALPGFFAWITNIEPLHYTWLGVRDVLFFSAERSAGLGTGAAGLATIMAGAVVLAAVTGPLWDRLTGRRGRPTLKG